jgi:hypothetical protein
MNDEFHVLGRSIQSGRDVKDDTMQVDLRRKVLDAMRRAGAVAGLAHHKPISR